MSDDAPKLGQSAEYYAAKFEHWFKEATKARAERNALEAELASLKTPPSEATRRVVELETALERIIASAGVPDPVEACRVVIKRAMDALGSNYQYGAPKTPTTGEGK